MFPELKLGESAVVVSRCDAADSPVTNPNLSCVAQAILAIRWPSVAAVGSWTGCAWGTPAQTWLGLVAGFCRSHLNSSASTIPGKMRGLLSKVGVLDTVTY